MVQALELAREQGDSIKDQIWRELAKARCSVRTRNASYDAGQLAGAKYEMASNALLSLHLP